ncbi:hypothetical protein BDN71DRAFT_588569 [Pleurotus eryngii]|uniref:Uncharacterized protein n=1 Tax=Pleurotus eryngii TaxID=5323 RepID=A0A9P5ZZP8_PLEER|nr:hypothetical protein BDN71DRAFT_588569 [Pleurotus eryngii]
MNVVFCGSILLSPMIGADEASVFWAPSTPGRQLCVVHDDCRASHRWTLAPPRPWKKLERGHEWLVFSVAVTLFPEA